MNYNQLSLLSNKISNLLCTQYHVLNAVNQSNQPLSGVQRSDILADHAKIKSGKSENKLVTGQNLSNSRTVVELFAGTESFSSVARKMGFDAFTVENNSFFSPSLLKDVRELTLKDFPEEFRNPHVLWASPPCTAFSVASIGKHWKLGSPSQDAELGNELLAHTFRLINLLRPKYWFIENPRGMMRTLPIMASLPRRTVTYCQYGDDRMKPTDIWTNCSSWISRSPCINGMSCHVSAPRGSRTGTQGLKGNMARSVIPSALCEEILMAVSAR